jgi:hypothetical protein
MMQNSEKDKVNKGSVLQDTAGMLWVVVAVTWDDRYDQDIIWIQPQDKEIELEQEHIWRTLRDAGFILVESTESTNELLG